MFLISLQVCVEILFCAKHYIQDIENISISLGELLLVGEEREQVVTMCVAFQARDSHRHVAGALNPASGFRHQDNFPEE